MKTAVLVVCFFASCLAQEYVPGTPGAPWTEEEVIIVKSKLFSLFGQWGGADALRQKHNGQLQGDWMTFPSAGKALRLGFHDCLKYQDGTGGCDGCLNWEGVGFKFDDAPGQRKYPNVGETNNNGLHLTVEALEYIYTDPNFPVGFAPALPESLKATGKSRADLWALASIVAVEYGIQTNNLVCDGTFNRNPQGQCNEFVGTDDCKSELSRPIKFYTGRRDCTEFGDETFKATKHESHPNAVGNGEMTMEFFAKDFNFTGRETVAIMGAHTMGRLHVGNSLFRYVWTNKGTHSFDNAYYRNIVRKPKYAFVNKCNKVPDQFHNIPETRWVVHTRKDTPNGGPVHWIHENYQCPDCHVNTGTCCSGFEGDTFCKVDALRNGTDKNINGGCNKFRFISGLDEMALPCEIGLYFNFSVTPDGIPYGCPGLERFNDNYWNNYLFTWSAVRKPWKPDRWMKADPQCGYNTLQYPEGSTPLHEIFEEYADDQQKWLDEFVPAFEKMLNNGYEDGELVLGPDQFTSVVCPRPERGDKYNECTKLPTKK